ncbi:MAG: squalene/phytoene synthase family protein [Chthoniobacteraceae bacterium]
MTRKELGGTLLASVSRSFYLSIKALPAALREPIGLAYLLARISDTIADAADAPLPTRLEALRDFQHQIVAGESCGLQISLSATNPAEQKLLGHVPEALAWLAAIEGADHADIVWVLGIIISGQIMDITRAWPVKSTEELDDYTWRVAGCVGEFWTRICFRHLPRYARLPLEEMIALGIRFGKGLQLVNILRDQAEDRRNGRIYLPGDPATATAHWLRTARKHFTATGQYIAAVRPWRLRYALILPWQLGLRTLDRLEAAGDAVATERIKVPRKEVQALLFTALWPACSNRALHALQKQSGFPLAREEKLR